MAEPEKLTPTDRIADLADALLAEGYSDDEVTEMLIGVAASVATETGDCAGGVAVCRSCFMAKAREAYTGIVQIQAEQRKAEAAEAARERN